MRFRVAPDHDGNSWKTLVEKPHAIDTTTHTFRLEFSGDQIRFLFDGVLAIETTDGTYPHGGYVGIEDYGCQIVVTDFRVETLAP